MLKIDPEDRAVLNQKHSETVYARKCEIKELNQEVTDTFLNQNHIQGSVQCQYSYGLVHEDRTVAVMTFSREKDESYNLSRYCTLPNVHAPGGAGKLLQHFIRTVHPSYIISFSDNRWSEGNLYRALGFELIKEVPISYMYFKASGEAVLEHKFGYRKKLIEKKLGPLLPGETEYQAMVRFGYDRIWDCGKKKWEMKIK